jgi:5-methylcytosine-specific restriction endonuclease McrA
MSMDKNICTGCEWSGSKLVCMTCHATGHVTRLKELGQGRKNSGKQVSRQGSEVKKPVKRKNGRKLPSTPRSRVKNALRQVWLRSRERAAALKRDGYTCQHCGVKQSTAKGREVSVEVHHRAGVLNWDAVIDAVYQHLLCGPDGLETVCKACHTDEHIGRR